MRFTPEQAAAIAAEALDSPYLFNARYHLERGDVRWAETIINHVQQVHPVDPPITADELNELMTAERARRVDVTAAAAREAGAAEQ